MSVQPNSIHLNEYNIDFDKLNRVIRTVDNNNFGKVKFEAMEIDQNAGFISTSTFKIWTNQVTDSIYNIIHCHINDMSDSVPVATETLGPNETIEDYKEFQTDSAGQVLRYKILIQNNQILTVLYNSGASIEEIPFQENKFSLDEPMMQAKLTDVFGDEPIIVEVGKIPNSMTCAHDKKELEDTQLETVEHEPLSHCTNRYFERLPGYIDVKMVSADNCNSIYSSEYKFSIPVCACEPIDDYQKTMILSMKQFQQEQSLKNVRDTVEELCVLVEVYPTLKITTLEEMKEQFTKIKTAEEKINQLLDSETESQAQELLDQAKEATTKSGKILRGMAAEMRMMNMKAST